MLDEPRNAALEAAIVQDPDDRTAYLVYADWLEGHGHPRAALIRAQVAEADPAQPGKRRIARELFARHKKLLLGPLASFEKALVWKFGFVRGVTLNDSTGNCVERVGAIARHPSTRLLGELAVMSHSLAEIAATLAATPLAALRSLSLTFDEARTKRGSEAVALRALLAALPELRTLAVRGPLASESLGDVLPRRLEKLFLYAIDDRTHDLRGELPASLREIVISGNVGLDRIALPELVSLALLECALPELAVPVTTKASFSVRTPADAAQIADAHWPCLATLGLRFGALPLADVESMFARLDAPALASLDLAGAPFADELCALLTDAPFCRQLRELSFAASSLTDTGTATLASSSCFDTLTHVTLAGSRTADPDLLRDARPELVVDGRARYDVDFE